MSERPSPSENEVSFPAARVNPFAFVSDTTFRFTLLVIAVLSSSLYIYNIAYYAVTPHGEAVVRFQCNELLRPALAGPLPTPVVEAMVKAVIKCSQPSSRRIDRIVLGGAALLLLVGAFVHAATPRWMMRRRRLVPLSDDDAPGVSDCFRRLCEEAGLRRQPLLLWDPLAPGGAALAFGRRRRPHVAVGAGLVIQFYRDRAAFEAVVRHELAHVANGDVGITYLSLSIWRAFVVAALLPYAVLLVRQPEGDIVAAAWHVAALAGLVYLIRNSVLRAREYYADVRVTHWDPDSALPRVLGTLPERRGPGWRRWLGLHPTASQRLAIVADTRPLLRLGVWDAVAAGLMTGLSIPILLEQVHVLIEALGTPVSLDHVATLTALVVAPLGAVIGAGVCREAFAARLSGEGAPRFGRIVVGLVTGYLVGDLLSLGRGTSDPLLPRPWFVAALLVGMMLIVGWMTAGANACVDESSTTRFQRRQRLVVLGSAALSVWTIGLLLSTQRGPVRGLPGVFAWTDYESTRPATLLAAIGACAFPLALALTGGRGDASGRGQSAALRPTPTEPEPSRSPFPLRRVGAWALAAGAFYAVVVLALYAIGFRHGATARSLGTYLYGDLNDLPEAARPVLAAKLGWFETQHLLAFAVAAVVAAVAAARAKGLATTVGLEAGFGAAVLTVPILLGLNLAFGGSVDADFALRVARVILAPAAFVALAGAILGDVAGRRSPLGLRAAADDAAAPASDELVAGRAKLRAPQPDRFQDLPR